MSHELFPYQKEGVLFLSERRTALLADEMGLGKTPQAICASDLVGAQRILIVCPAIARINWQREYNRWSLLGHPSVVVETAKFDLAPVVITSFEMLMNPKVQKQLKEHDPDTVIVDEAHYLKSRKAKRTKLLLGARCQGGGLVPDTARLWCLSGTPAPNHPAEVWPMLHRFGAYEKGYWDFVKEFCTGYDGPYGHKITGAKNIERLKRCLKPVMLRRRKDQVAKDLPSITFKDVYIPLRKLDTDDLMAFFRTLWQEEDVVMPRLKKQEQALRAIFDTKPKLDDVMRALEGLAGSMSTLRQWIGVAKGEACAQLIKNDLEGGMDKVVVFAHHRVVIRALSEYYLKEFKPDVIWGGTSPTKKQGAIDRFQKGKKRVIICQIQAAGTAIDLTASHNVVFVEPDWVPGNNAQAAMRVHRHGQKKPVLVRFLAAEGSIDEYIMKAFRKKAQTLMKIYDD